MLETRRDDYKDLMHNVGKDKVREFMRFLQERAQQFIKEASYEDSVICNDWIFTVILNG